MDMIKDRDAYLRDVLEPARKDGGRPPEDLWDRYALDESVVVDGALETHLKDVRGAWASLSRSKVYKSLVVALQAQDAELEHSGRLTAPALVVARQRRLDEAIAELKALSAGNDAIARDSFNGLKLKCRRVFSDAELLAALAGFGVAVVDPIELPTEPPDRSAGALGGYLRVIGKELSIDVLTEEIAAREFKVLGGVAVSLGDITTAEDRERVRPYDSRKAAFTSIVGILKRVVQAGTLATLLKWELAELGRRELVLGVTTQRRLATRLAQTGLDPREASILAVSIISVPASSAGPAAEIDDALATGRLRHAQALAIGLADDDPRHQQIDSFVRRVDGLGAEAQRELVEGRAETAAKLLHDACDIAGDDDDLVSRLHRIPPPAPPRVAAITDGNTVSVRWAASAIRTGAVSYRVVRGVARAPMSFEDGDLVVETDQTETVDRSAPAGESLVYAVCARRWEGWSAPVAASPVVRAPEIDGLCADADEESVSLQWSMPPAAKRAVVSRRTGSSGWDIQTGDAKRSVSLGSYVDRTVVRGTRYSYRVSAAYVTSHGDERVTDGRVVEVVPQAHPRAVCDLEIAVEQVDGSSVAIATFTPPGEDDVTLIVTDAPPGWGAGSTIPVASIVVGRAVPGVPQPTSDGRFRLLFSVEPGRHWVTPVTANSTLCAIGNTVALRLVDPVSHLHADRFGAEIRLGWVWPKAATHARARWFVATNPVVGGGVVISRPAYFQDGGCRLATVWAPAVVEVTAIIRDEVDAVSPTVQLAVGVPKRVRYTIEKDGPSWSLRRIVRFVVDQGMRVPSILITHHDSIAQPRSADGGIVLRRIEARMLTPDETAVEEVRIPRRAGWLMCFLAENDPEIVLVHPPATAMRS